MKQGPWTDVYALGSVVLLRDHRAYAAGSRWRGWSTTHWCRCAGRRRPLQRTFPARDRPRAGRAPRGSAAAAPPRCEPSSASKSGARARRKSNRIPTAPMPLEATATAGDGATVPPIKPPPALKPPSGPRPRRARRRAAAAAGTAHQPRVVIGLLAAALAVTATGGLGWWWWSSDASSGVEPQTGAEAPADARRPPNPTSAIRRRRLRQRPTTTMPSALTTERAGTVGRAATGIDRAGDRASRHCPPRRLPCRRRASDPRLRGCRPVPPLERIRQTRAAPTSLPRVSLGEELSAQDHATLERECRK